MSKDKKTELAVVKGSGAEIVEAKPVISAAIFHDEETGLYGVNVTPSKMSLEAMKAGRIIFKPLEELGTEEAWPSAWMQKEDAQELADALHAAGIMPSRPNDIVTLLQKELEDAKDFSRDLMDVLKAGREG